MNANLLKIKFKFHRDDRGIKIILMWKIQ